MTVSLKIDFVSDVSCPWCVIGLNALEQAIERLPMAVSAQFHFQPFELNPDMPPGGQDITAHIAQKYGATAQQSAANREVIRERGEALGFTFSMDKRGRIYNTFDAHRALFTAYFTHGYDPSSHEVLIALAAEAGLDQDDAARILSSGEYADEVRERERTYLDLGINSVPAMIINDKYLLQGGQPVEAFEAALLQIIES